MINKKNLTKEWEISDIKGITLKTSTENPNKENPNKLFYYIDISSIDLEKHKIILNSPILGKNAPSRARQKVKIDDVLISTVRPNLNAVTLIPKDLDNQICSTGFCILRTNKKVLPKFLFYYTRTNYFVDNLIMRCRGASYPAVTNKDVFSVKISFPNLSVQQKIVDILEKAEKLKKWRIHADKLADMYLKSVFKQMFLDQNFKECILRDFTKLISSGSTPKGGRDVYLEDGSILFIRSQNVLMNKFSEHDALYLPLEIHKRMKRTWVKNKDVLLNITGASIGRTTIYEGEDDKANVNQHVCIIRLKNLKTFNPYYLNSYLSSLPMQEYIIRMNAGATRQALNFSQIGKFKIPIPPIEIQNQFAEIFRKVEILKTQQKESKVQIDNLFDNLMQKAFRGELVC